MMSFPIWTISKADQPRRSRARFDLASVPRPRRQPRRTLWATIPVDHPLDQHERPVALLPSVRVGLARHHMAEIGGALRRLDEIGMAKPPRHSVGIDHDQPGARLGVTMRRRCRH